MRAKRYKIQIAKAINARDTIKFNAYDLVDFLEAVTPLKPAKNASRATKTAWTRLAAYWILGDLCRSVKIQAIVKRPNEQDSNTRMLKACSRAWS